ncbi:MAG: hypothetical protein IKN59_00350 [Paludibacteraceae bacterium]|nr:hypothetical protein [Paludibacteraceae bacterium]
MNDDLRRTNKTMVSQRIPHEYLQSGIGAQRILADALAITTRCSRRASQTLERDAQVVTSDERASRDGSNTLMELAIMQYAKANGFWYDNPVAAMNARYGTDMCVGEGQESIVWADVERGVVVKAKNTTMYETLEEFFESVVLNNWLFEDCRQTIFGFGYDAQGMFRTLLETPYIEKTDFRPMTPMEKNDYLALFGFSPLSRRSYSNDWYEVKDTHNQNMVIASDGTVAVIDAVIKWPLGEHYRERTSQEMAIDEQNEAFLDGMFGYI